MIYAIEFSKHAERQFDKLNHQTRKRIAKKIDALSSNPRPNGVEKLETEDPRYRVRVGSYRIVYKIFDGVLLVTVLEIGGPQRCLSPVVRQPVSWNEREIGDFAY